MCIMEAKSASDAIEEDLVPSNRRSNKPLMEKKRRQRINRCLNELKTLVLEALKKDPSRYSKLEKADILEMTVRHVQALHRYEAGGGRRIKGGLRSVGSQDRAKYRAGFAQCAIEVTRYLGSMSGVPRDLHKKVVSHLNSVNSVFAGGAVAPEVPSGGASMVVGRGIVTVAPPTTAHARAAPPTTAHAPSAAPPPMIAASSEVPISSSPVRVGANVTLVPARLASGQMALVLPPGTGLPLDATQSNPPVVSSTDTASDDQALPETDAGTGEYLAPSTYSFMKDPRPLASSIDDNHVFPCLPSTKSFAFGLTKDSSHSFDGESSAAPSSHLPSFLSGNAMQAHRLNVPNLLSTAPPLRSSPVQNAISSLNPCTTTCPSQSLHSNDASSCIGGQSATYQLERSEVVTSATENEVTPSDFTTPILPTLVRPTPTLPLRARATTSNELQPQEAAPSPPNSALLHEPLNLVTHSQSREAPSGDCDRRSYKAASSSSSSVWRRTTPYHLPHTGRSTQPWRPW